ncbi:RDD family protein [Akkermansiaceae bacterium]|nr:RDD family protein [Akkermansiaceae bacterium]
MSEQVDPIPKPSIPKPSIPKPTIREAPPVQSSASTPDPVALKAPEIKEDESLGSVLTPMGKRVEADLVKRFLGGVIDFIVAGIVASIVGSITGVNMLQHLAWAVVMLTRDSLPMLEGQSIGKKVMKTKAVKVDGSPLTGDWMTGATRNVLLAIPLIGIVEVFIIVMRSGKLGSGLRFGDDWAKTKVISVD